MDFVIHVVDDQRAMRALVADIIVKSGLCKNVVQHADARSLLRTISTSRCDVVVSDWNMPEMSGLDMLRSIRNSPDAFVRRVPVILVTGEAKAENVIEAHKAGVTDYVVKPLKPETLLHKLNGVLSKLQAAASGAVY